MAECPGQEAEKAVVLMAYTQGEVLGLISGPMKLPPEDIDNYIIIVEGKCPDCNERNGITILQTYSSMADFMHCIEGALLSVRGEDFDG